MIVIDALKEESVTPASCASVRHDLIHRINNLASRELYWTEYMNFKVL